MNLAKLPNPFKDLVIPIFQVPVVDPNRNNTSIGVAISKLLPYVFGAAAIIFLVYLVTSGLQLMLSRGDPKAVQAAQARITASLIGLIIVVLAYVLVKLLGQILGIQIFTKIFT